MNKIETTLLDIGIPANQLGFAYISAALAHITEDNSYTYNTCALYARVAEDAGATPGRVERAILHSIESAFDRVAPETLERYFGNNVRPDKGRPTNSEFLATVALHLRGGGV